MKKSFIIFLLIMVLCLVCGCAKTKGDYFGDGPSSDDAYMKGDISGEIIGGESGIKEPSENEYKPGQLTVCAYNDNDYFDFYNTLTIRGQEKNGIFYEYQNKFNLPNNRICLTFKNSNNVKVELIEDGKTVYTSYTDQNGKCYLFNNNEYEKYDIKVTYTKDSNSVSENMQVSNNEEIDLGISKADTNVIQLMFVVDTTGSMGDEINYLKAEIKNVCETIKKENSDVTLYLALMFYRDINDEYVTKYFDFTEDVDSQVTNLEKQKANGGGDFEEAVQEAFSIACTKQWVVRNETKILIHVADAPSHDSDVDKWFSSVKKLSSMGVRIINVASSGIDKKTEYLFRNECFMTNGYYCYLTNDSGIGNDHIDATVYEKPTVEYLNECLIRLINGMHTGIMKDAVYYKQSQQ